MHGHWTYDESSVLKFNLMERVLSEDAVTTETQATHLSCVYE
jgi:hypothetical protein